MNSSFYYYLCRSENANAMRKKVRELIEILEADGWYLDRQKGSHKQYKHPTKRGTVTIPDHGKNDELEHFLVSSILKQAGLK